MLSPGRRDGNGPPTWKCCCPPLAAGQLVACPGLIDLRTSLAAEPLCPLGAWCLVWPSPPCSGLSQSAATARELPADASPGCHRWPLAFEGFSALAERLNRRPAWAGRRAKLALPCSRLAGLASFGWR